MIFKSVSDISKQYINKFDCGTKELNKYLICYSQKNDRLNVGKTFVLFDDIEGVIGYFTLANAHIEFNSVPSTLKNCLPRYPLPCIRIARLAIDIKHQHKGCGKQLLKEAFNKILFLTQFTGIAFIIVDAKEQSKTFYEHFGFKKLPIRELTYILTVDVLKKSNNYFSQE